MKHFRTITIFLFAFCILTSCTGLKEVWKRIQHDPDLPTEVDLVRMRTGNSEWSIIGNFLDSNNEIDYHMDIFKKTIYNAQTGSYEETKFCIIRHVPFKEGQYFRIRKNESWENTKGANNKHEYDRHLNHGEFREVVKDGEPFYPHGVESEQICILYWPDREAIVIYDSYYHPNDSWNYNAPFYSNGESWPDESNKPDEPQWTETGYDQTPFAAYTFSADYGGSWYEFEKDIDLSQGYTIIMHLYAEVTGNEKRASVIKFSEEKDMSSYYERTQIVFSSDTWQSCTYHKGNETLGEPPLFTSLLYASDGLKSFIAPSFPSNEYITENCAIELQPNEWSSIALVGNGKTHSMYVDSKKCIEQEAEISIPLTKIGALEFGQDRGPQVVDWENRRFNAFDGSIAYISIWNRPLSRQEIAMNTYTVPSGNGLIAFWKMTEGEGSVFVNSGDANYNIDMSKLTRRIGYETVYGDGWEQQEDLGNWEDIDATPGLTWSEGYHWPEYKEKQKEGI